MKEEAILKLLYNIKAAIREDPVIAEIIVEDAIRKLENENKKPWCWP